MLQSRNCSAAAAFVGRQLIKFIFAPDEIRQESRLNSSPTLCNQTSSGAFNKCWIAVLSSLLLEIYVYLSGLHCNTVF